MNDRLTEILEHKRREVAASKERVSLSDLKAGIGHAASVRDFPAALRGPGVSLIAEIKKASPSKGVIAPNFDHRQLASLFESGGARALSVLTDRQYFQGDPRYIKDVKEQSALPVLRKDFILEEYQVFESRALGADAILLIVRALPEEVLAALHDCARNLGLSVLMEVHNEREVTVANRLHPSMIGVNNRNLSDFSVSLDQSLRLKPLIANGCLTVSESGIRSKADIAKLRDAGFDAFLVGETLMASGDQVRTLQELIRA